MYAAALIVRRKWNTTARNLQPGDVVIAADKNTLRGEYRLGLVHEVFPGSLSSIGYVQERPSREQD